MADGPSKGLHGTLSDWKTLHKSSFEQPLRIPRRRRSLGWASASSLRTNANRSEPESRKGRHPMLCVGSLAACYSGFDSAFYKKLDAERHVSQENATFHDFKRSTVESKPL
jgi:hypothetical protein